MRTVFLIVLTIFFLGSVDQSSAQTTTPKKGVAGQKSGSTTKSNANSAQDMFARNAAIAQGKDPDKIKLPSDKKTTFPKGSTGGFAPRSNSGGTGFAIGGGGINRPSSEEQQKIAKERYKEIFAPDKTYEVRLRNKALALRRGKFMGMAQRNTLAVFESNRQIVAVPKNKLHKSLTGKVEAQIKKAMEVYQETKVAFDDVFEIPDSGDNKSVGLAGREKIKMYLFNKPKVEKPKKDKKKKTAAKDESETDSAK